MLFGLLLLEVRLVVVTVLLLEELTVSAHFSGDLLTETALHHCLELLREAINHNVHHNISMTLQKHRSTAVDDNSCLTTCCDHG